MHYNLTKLDDFMLVVSHETHLFEGTGERVQATKRHHLTFN